MIELEKRIKAEYRRLTRNQRKVTDLLLTNPEHLAFSTAREVGARLGVSESTVIRLAYALGYAGFPALQAAVREKFLSYLSTVERLNKSWESDGSKLSIFHRMLYLDIENIRSTIATNPDATFRAAERLILKARHIYIVGLRKSYALSAYLHFCLSMMLNNSSLIGITMGDLPEQLKKIGREDLVIGICFRRYSDTTVEAFRCAKVQGAKSLAITDSVKSPVAPFADVTLICDTTRSISFTESLVAPLAVVHALVVALSLHSKERARKTLETLEGLYRKFGTLHRP
ncbi:MAG: hypothetical protein A3G35_10560 [candidate division NC10 bacterium RIFCSPLOWO2_12_FULL_66_18]|nr:MAG: hypothetical protein A3H39_00175 [candidate division NC10 bacterium RIFCSPLOWO2_02_FULL_66_22]OGC00372.1 MAG: hypothetical protein A3G35_10560 [candidate division NC10 bacterium RIFCSPLOWO2_12_FULL_66_18]